MATNDYTNPNAGRYIPFKKGGWGVALFIIVLTIATASLATWIHKTTYLHPQDLRMRAKGAPALHP
jgi:hypothetical protein